MSAVLEARIAGLEARMTALEARGSGGSASNGGQSNGGGEVASDYEMGGMYGDKVIGKDPKQWLDQGGESYAGNKMSECPSDYLLAVAGLYEWQARKDEEQGKTYRPKSGKNVGVDMPTAPLKRKDAALARGWAKRNAGAQSAPQAPSAAPTRQPRQAVPQGPPKAAQDDYSDFGDDDNGLPF